MSSSAALQEDTVPAVQAKAPKPGDTVTIPDGTTTCYLLCPLDVGEKQISLITLHEPSAGELEVLDKGKGGVQSTNYLIAKISGHPYAVICRLSARDWTSVSNVVNKYLGKPQEIGGISSEI